MTTEKTIALTIWIFVSRLMSLLFNMLSRFVIVFLPRSKHLLISWLQSPSTDGKWQFLVSRAPSWLQIRPFGDISWPFHHMVLGMFIPSLAKISLVGHSMCYTRPLLVSKSLWTTCLSSLLWSRKIFPLVTSSHIQSFAITIINLIWNYVFSFYHRLSHTFVNARSYNFIRCAI